MRASTLGSELDSTSDTCHETEYEDSFGSAHANAIQTVLLQVNEVPRRRRLLHDPFQPAKLR